MGWIKWKRTPHDGAAAAWRTEWIRALAEPTPAAADALEAQLERLRRETAGTGDIEIEEEMLDALRQLVTLAESLAAGHLPSIETRHRLAETGVCHFSAPASMPDDPAQPSGRLLFTSRRAVFAGGGAAAPLPWHQVREVVHIDRDLLIARHTIEEIQRYRFNSFADAVCAAALARHLTARARRI